MEREKRQKELLEELRGVMIAKFKCEPFKILPDEVITEIIGQQPSTKKQLAGIKGMPKEGFRVSKYGEAILKIVKDWKKIESVDVIGSNEDGYTINLVLKRLEAF